MRTIVGQSTMELKGVSRQFATFSIDGRLYGIDVMKVQEVTRPMTISTMRTAPDFIKGLINLRGQIATAIGIRELFQISSRSTGEGMTVVCKVEDSLISLIVDQIGDVIEVDEGQFEPSPRTIPDSIKKYMTGIYKTQDSILSVLNLTTIIHDLEKRCA